MSYRTLVFFSLALIFFPINATAGSEIKNSQLRLTVTTMHALVVIL